MGFELVSDQYDDEKKAYRVGVVVFTFVLAPVLCGCAVAYYGARAATIPERVSGAVWAFVSVFVLSAVLVVARLLYEEKRTGLDLAGSFLRLEWLDRRFAWEAFRAIVLAVVSFLAYVVGCFQIFRTFPDNSGVTALLVTALYAFLTFWMFLGFGLIRRTNAD